MLKYLQLPFSFEVSRLQQEVDAIENQYWLAHYQTLHYSGGWSAIPLRSLAGKIDNIYALPEERGCKYQSTSFLLNAPYLQEVLSAFQCPLLGVRLLKLDAGAIIKEHRDADLAFELGEVRIHIPIVTNDAIEFYLDKERVILKEGECWYMNFNLSHAIYNKGTEARIHLVIDAKVNEWVKSTFEQPGLLKKEEKERKQLDVNVQLQIIAQLREMNTPTSNKMANDLENEIASQQA